GRRAGGRSCRESVQRIVETYADPSLPPELCLEPVSVVPAAVSGRGLDILGVRGRRGRVLGLAPLDPSSRRLLGSRGAPCALAELLPPPRGLFGGGIRLAGLAQVRPPIRRCRGGRTLFSFCRSPGRLGRCALPPRLH